MKNWNTWRLIGVTGATLLAVLFVVIWQAVTEQTRTLNQVIERLNELEEIPDTNDNHLLERQLESIQNRQQEQALELNKLRAQQQINETRKERRHPESTSWSDQNEQPLSAPPSLKQ